MRPNIIAMLNIYNRAFPSLQTDEGTFSERLMIDSGSVIFEHREEGILTGYSVVNDDGILLLCVDDNFRRKGIGTELLKISENHIKKNFDKVTLGISRNTYLFCGVPINKDCDSRPFFLKHGYSETGTNFDMVIDLSEYTRIHELDNHDDNIIIRHRRNDKEDIEKSIKCGDVIDGWGAFYKDATDLIVAEADGEIIGAVIADPQHCIFSGSLKDAGTLACLGVIKEYRAHGIGMKLCQEALCSLKNSGCKICHIGYTWLDWWYGKLGATKYISYWMGDKMEV